MSRQSLNRDYRQSIENNWMKQLSVGKCVADKCDAPCLHEDGKLCSIHELAWMAEHDCQPSSEASWRGVSEWIIHRIMKSIKTLE